MSKLPQPINGTEEYLKAIHLELVKINDHMAAQAPAVDPALVGLKEPAVSGRKIGEAIDKEIRKQSPRKA